MNLASGLFEVQNDTSFSYDGSGGGDIAVFDNYGTFRKRLGTGTTTFDGNVAFNNTGTLEALSGTLAFNGGYTMTGGGVTLGFTSATDFGKVTVSGEAPLTGALGARLLGGYVPAVGAAFPVMTFGSRSGTFTDTNGLNVGSQRYFEPAYTATTLTLTSRYTNDVPPTPVPLPANCVAWWRGEYNFLDSAGTNHGYGSNAVAFTTGEVGQALTFNGSNSFVAVPDAPTLHFGLSDITIETWMKEPPGTTDRVLLYKEASSYPFAGIFFNLLPDGTVGFSVTDCGTGSCGFGSSRDAVRSPSRLEDNLFHHVVGVRVSTGYLLFVDGQLVATRTEAARNADNSEPVYIGAAGPYGNNQVALPLAGRIDELAIYNRALSSNEIASIYAAGSAGKVLPATAPTITAQPQSVTNVVGGTATFTVTATGTAPLSYQWRKEGVPIANATNSAFSLQPLALSHAGNYTVVVSNSVNSITSAVAVLSVTNPVAMPLPANCVAWWRGEGNGLDAIGTNHGTLMNGATFAAGGVGQGFSLDGADDVVSVPHSANLSFATNAPMSVEFWAYTSSSSTRMHFLAKRDGCGGPNYQFVLWDASGIGFMGNDFSAWSGRPMPLNTWAHLAGTFDGTTLRTYLNGELVGSAAGSLGLPSNSPLTIGAPGTCGAYLFAGRIDELAFYSRALSTNEIAAIYAAGSAGKLLPSSAPAITAQPQSVTNVVGGTANFTVTATGTAPLSYQWRKESVAIANATNSALSLEPLALAHAGNYTVVVSNSVNSITSAVAVLTVTNPAAVPLPAGCVAWWRGENTMLDAAGTNHGASFNGVAYAPGKVGQAFRFDGTNAVIVPDAPSLRFGTSGLTVEAWIKAPPGAPDGVLLEKLQYPQYPYATIELYQEAGKFSFAVTDCGTSSCGYNSPGKMPVWSPTRLDDGQWRHIAGVRTSTALELHVDGQLVATLVQGPLNPDNSSPLYFGAGITNAAGQLVSAWTGLVDELILYNRALTASEITGIYAAGSAGKALSATAPSITAQPQSRTNIAGTTATFSVTATGTAPLNYQWRKAGVPLANGGNVSGATSNVLTLANVQLADAGNYTVVVTNLAGAVTSAPPAVLTMWEKPAITSQPQSRTNLVGETASFTVAAVGTPPPAFQWQRNGTNLPNAGNISGATTATLTLTSVAAVDAASYTVVVTNLAGAVTSTPPAVLTIWSKPTITAQPQSRTNLVGEAATFTVAAVGTPPPAFQWRRNGTNLPNAANISGVTTTVLTLANVTTNDAASYTVVVTNLAGAITSAPPAFLTVWVPVAITAQPQSQTVMEGGTATFTVTATGTAPLSYQWSFNGVAMTSKTNSSLTLTGMQTNQAGSYRVLVSNVAGSTNSATAALAVQYYQDSVFANTNLIRIRDYTTATPYPSTIPVSGVAGTLSKVTVTLSRLSHTWPGDIDALVVGPLGQKAMLMSDAGGYAAADVTFTFDDDASGWLPESDWLVSGTFKPTDYAGYDPTNDVFAAPAPAGPYFATLMNFIGSVPNGSWSLFVRDDDGKDLGQIANGWSLNLRTLNTATGAQAAALRLLPETLMQLPDGRHQFSLTGEAGRAVEIWGCNDLKTWVLLGTVPNPTGTTTFTDPATNAPVRFYRWRML